MSACRSSLLRTGLRTLASKEQPSTAAAAGGSATTSSPKLGPDGLPFQATPAASTIPAKFVANLPVAWQPYAKLARLDKPIGTWLLFSPCTWAITMAAYQTGAPLSHTLWILGLFGIGSVIMRGAGCTINDMVDHDLDNKVARTRLRPVAAGDVSMKQATTFLGAQCFAGLAVLLSLPSDCFLLGAASLPLVFTYPMFKRFTYYPQIVLSTCFTWGALLGFPAMGVWNIPAMLTLHASSFAWCMIYDTIYAHQDKLFDIEIGIKSTALKWGERTKEIMSRYGIAQIALLTASGLFAGMGPCFFAGTLWAAYRLFDMIKRVDLDNPDDCWQWFLRNIRTGHVVWLGAAADYIAKLLGIGLF